MDQFTLLRYLCSLDINIDEIKLGGDGKIVEIDESLFTKEVEQEEVFVVVVQLFILISWHKFRV